MDFYKTVSSSRSSDSSDTSLFSTHSSDSTRSTSPVVLEGQIGSILSFFTNISGLRKSLAPDKFEKHTSRKNDTISEPVTHEKGVTIATTPPDSITLIAEKLGALADPIQDFTKGLWRNDTPFTKALIQCIDIVRAQNKKLLQNLKKDVTTHYNTHLKVKSKSKSFTDLQEMTNTHILCLQDIIGSLNEHLSAEENSNLKTFLTLIFQKVVPKQLKDESAIPEEKRKDIFNQFLFLRIIMPMMLFKENKMKDLIKILTKLFNNPTRVDYTSGITMQFRKAEKGSCISGGSTPLKKSFETLQGLPNLLYTAETAAAAVVAETSSD
ncbi:hypothetical protein DID77_00240 [Candidatus Marinamargulisbacteria bacterium SCGC AG-439-L15]|nr:hypothetical protein DID77_00240 [Candidatus Marinamargulisbacteria bacterium SCGC AG-439-L15]